MKKKTVTIWCFAILCLAGCSKNSHPVLHIKRAASGAREGVYYSLFVRSFADSDGDGVGDLTGLIQKLDYLNDGCDETETDLGVTGIWLLPIFPSPSYHGYDVSDYYSINPEYGTMADFEALIAEADKRGISIILDLTCNHSSVDHPWFRASENPADTHRSWYYWLDGEGAKQQGLGIQKQVWGHNLWNKRQNGYYAGLFDKKMPDLNLAEPAVRTALKDVAAFWLKKGVAGFRLDAAAHVFNTNKIPAGRSGLSDSLDWWTEFSAFCKSIKPDVYLVAEVWDTTSTRAAYFQALDSNFHFDLGTAIITTIRLGKAGKNNFAKTLYADYHLYKEANPAYIDAPFLTNHDQNRIAGMLRGDVRLLKLAASLYLLTEGIPFIYYGEEIGMMGAKPDEQLRTPFLWADKGSDPLQTKWIDSKYNAKTLPLAQQNRKDDSLAAHYRTLIRLKTGLPALLRGRMEPLDTGNAALISYCLRHGEAAVFVVHNLSSEPVDFELPESVQSFTLFYTSEYDTHRKTQSVHIAPRSTALFTTDQQH